MAKVKKHQFEHSKWHYFVQNYLKIAELACLEMTGHKYTRYNRLGKNKTVLLAKNREFKVNDLYISTIFSIKHAIEIAIKTLNGALIDDVPDYTHDTKELMEILKKQIKNVNVRKNIDTLLGDSWPEDTMEEQEAAKFFKEIKSKVQALNDYLTKFEVIANKYYHCEFLKDKIGDLFIIEDCDNTAFRYPSNSMSIQLDYEKITEKISDKDIEMILKDIHDLSWAFYAIDLALVFGNDNMKK